MIRQSVVFSLGLALAAVGCGPRSGEFEAPSTAGSAGNGVVSKVEPGSRPEPLPEPEQEPALDPSRVLVTVRYADGSLSGRVEDREVRVGDRSFKLSRLRRWQRGPAERVELDEGAAIDGKVEGLDPLVLTIGGRPSHPDLALATVVDFEAPPELAPVPSLDELKKGRFLRPFYSVNPVTSYRVSTSEKVEDRSITRLQPEFLIYSSSKTTPNQGYMAQLIRMQKSRKAEPIELGKVYETADGRGTKFIVWEFEKADRYEDYERKSNNEGWPKEGSPFKRLAIDYSGFLNDKSSAGMIRYNSSFK